MAEECKECRERTVGKYCSARCKRRAKRKRKSARKRKNWVIVPAYVVQQRNHDQAMHDAGDDF